MESSRLSRALKLLNLLQSGHGATVDYLAHALQCSKRTVFRDIKLLNDNNIRVWFDDRLGGYTAEHQLWALASSMDEDEFVNLLVSAVLSAVPPLGPSEGIVDQAVAKLMGRATTQTRNRVNRLVRAIVPPLSSIELDHEQRETFKAIVLAIERRHQIRVRWKGPGGAPTLSTKLSPFRLVFDTPPPLETTRHSKKLEPLVATGSEDDEEEQWLVGGQSTLHRRVVYICLKCIVSVEETPDSFEVPIEFLQAGCTGSAMPGYAEPNVGTIPQPPETPAKGKKVRRGQRGGRRKIQHSGGGSS